MAGPRGLRPASPPRPASCSGPRARESRRRRDRLAMLEMAVQPADRFPRRHRLVHRAVDEAAAPAAKQSQLPVGIVSPVADPASPEHVTPRHRVPRMAAVAREDLADLLAQLRDTISSASSERIHSPCACSTRSSSGRRTPATAARTRDRSARGRSSRSCRTTRRPPRSARRPSRRLQARADALLLVVHHDDHGQARAAHPSASSTAASTAAGASEAIIRPRSTARAGRRRRDRSARPTSDLDPDASRVPERGGHVQRPGVRGHHHAGPAEQRQQRVEVGRRRQDAPRAPSTMRARRASSAPGPR